MSSLTDQAKHMKLVAQWKLDQQSRILKLNSQLREIEDRISRYKNDLADQSLILFAQNELKAEELIEICKKIEETTTEANNIRTQIESVKTERTPDPVVYNKNVPIHKSGLVCPKCGKKLIGEFCPDDGSRGVRETVTVTPGSGLVCPKCGKPIPVKFCLFDGTEGVPVTTAHPTLEELAAIQPEPSKSGTQPEPEPSEPLCPKCGTPVPIRFCPKCGTEVIKPKKQMIEPEKPKAKKKTGG